MVQGSLLLEVILKCRIILQGWNRHLLLKTNTCGEIRVTIQRLKYSSITSSREANRIGRFQYPGDSNSPSNLSSFLIICKISRRDLVGAVGDAVRANALYFCLASTYL